MPEVTALTGENLTGSPDLPLVTIITPAYNRETLIEETILSVLGKDYPRLEYIVLDDGSSDGTLQVIRKYEGRLRSDSHTNMGETATVNKGFSMASGEIIGVVNSDDPLLPGAVAKLVNALLNNPAVKVVYPDWNLIDAEGCTLQTRETYEYTGYADMVRRHFCLPGPGAFFKRELLREIGGRDPLFRYLGDLDFWYRAGLTGDFQRVPEVLATFRVHPGSATVSQRNLLMAEEHMALMEKLFHMPGLPESLLAVKKEAFSSAAFVAGSCLGAGAFREKLNYFMNALRLCPAKYAGEYRRRIVMMALLLLGVPGDRAYNFLIRFRRSSGRP